MLEANAADVARVQADGIACRAVPLMMTDPDATAAMALAAFAIYFFLIPSPLPPQ